MGNICCKSNEQLPMACASKTRELTFSTDDHIARSSEDETSEKGVTRNQIPKEINSDPNKEPQKPLPQEIPTEPTLLNPTFLTREAIKIETEEQTAQKFQCYVEFTQKFLKDVSIDTYPNCTRSCCNINSIGKKYLLSIKKKAKVYQVHFTFKVFKKHQIFLDSTWKTKIQAETRCKQIVEEMDQGLYQNDQKN